MLALFDEATREGPRGLFYVVATVVLVSDPNATRTRLAATIPAGRKRAWFHWNEEGVEARRRIIEAMVDARATARTAVHYPTGRRRQEEARAKVLGHLVEQLGYDGVTSLVFERRDGPGHSHLDWRDRATVLQVLGALDLDSTVNYEHVGKTEPLLWMADAIAGATAQWLTQDDPEWFDILRSVGVVVRDPTFLA